MPATLVQSVPIAPAAETTSLALGPHEKCPPANPETGKWFPNRIVLHWLTTFMRLASRKTLQEDDLFDILPKFQAKALGKLTEESLSQAANPKKKTPKKRPEMVQAHPMEQVGEHSAFSPTPSTNWDEDFEKPEDTFVEPTGFISPALQLAVRKHLMKCAWRAFKFDWIASAIAHIVAALAGVVSPLILEQILSTILDASAPKWRGYVLSIALLALQMIQSIANCYHAKKDADLGVGLKSIIIGAVYRKALKLSTVARQEYPNGRVVNLLSTDAMAFEYFGLIVHDAWVVPLHILATSALIIYYLRLAGLAGIGLMVLCSFLQSLMVGWISDYEEVAMKHTDERIKRTSEVLNGIKIIKLFAWEESFFKRIDQTRIQELKFLKKANVLSALFYGISYIIPSLVAVATFIVYQVALGQELNAEIIFPALALINQLRAPLTAVPEIAGYLVQANVVLGRVTRFLAAPEAEEPADLKLLAKKDYAGKPGMAICIRNADFEWEKWTGESDLQMDEAGSLSSDTSHYRFIELSPASARIMPQLSATFSAASSQMSMVSVLFPNQGSGLKDINLEVPVNSLVAVIGPVGSGKSSLLFGLLGEMRHTQGRSDTLQPIAYSPQQAWLVNATLRDNILFGTPYDAVKFKAVIKASALARDLEQLPRGDMTQVGERGIALSGGQAARVNLARAMYADAKILLLDDPLAAVDAHVGRQIFEDGIMRYCASKTRILVTHHLRVLPSVNYILYLEHNKIVEQGSYQSLMEQDGKVAELMREHNKDEHAVPDKVSNVSNLAISPQQAQGGSRLASPASLMARARPVSPALSMNKQASTAGNLIIDEEREEGAVKFSLYLVYLKAAGGYSIWGFIALVVLVMQADKIVTDLWLVWWSVVRFNMGQNIYVSVYAGLAALQAFAAAFLALISVFAGLEASKILHRRAMRRLVYAPMAFFDGTPLGQILSRFSRDIGEIDRWLAITVRSTMNLWGSVVACVALVGYAVPVIFAIFAPLLPIYYFVQKYYRNAARELKRIESIARSPLFAHFNESLTGIATMRSYRAASRFIFRAELYLDKANRPTLIKYYVNAWVALRMEILVGLICFMVAVLGLALSIDAALLGLALSYTLSMTGSLNMAMHATANTEARMNCVERINYYATEIPTEAPDTEAPTKRVPTPKDSRRIHPDPETRASETDLSAKSDPNLPRVRVKPNLPRLTIPLPNWPSLGNIQFEQYTLKYNPGNPAVLKDISLSINAGEKIGIVGRTGAGKSSIIAGLYRLVEASAGKISIDGIDISTLPVKQLRRNLSIIPQTPVLFEGTVRSNLDPSASHTDKVLWKILDRCRLKSFVSSMPKKLDGAVTENGDNLSVGQRQLFCLGRAMLMSAKILLIDEATANVDFETDGMIQQVLRTHLRKCTILTIAHRISTIMDYDKILVLDQGRVAEFDAPAVLLANPKSIFTQLAEETAAESTPDSQDLKLSPDRNWTDPAGHDEHDENMHISEINLDK
ncbi:P-loop containing nucleoside triphosphate hydrolase protein [Phlyctochytrium arcticum]|nr:P-loop containing nucleoside triphosphate hydrolase protein [Phlyctochytrium arcticum]